ncbi:hypothetical protein HYALB_00002869 [Hymenoscyphus albidus]|uniref:Methylated-DNA--protein-cysteine methyltransferase n=1 Tax=Hymenoscyphus albidus TaxID=595503 RepID=A0A9N9PSH5_9HELO|nr:hypothetical protein HYALB_00002869 [Hymenoscyphus albidus]
MAPSDLQDLQANWKELCQKTLPAAATAKDPAQSKWPVLVDHCFARIVLDNVVGVDSPWKEKLKSPAYKNMSQPQLESCIELGFKILDGAVDLVGLNEKSLALRGKQESVKRKRSEEPTSEDDEVKKRKLSLSLQPDSSAQDQNRNRNRNRKLITGEISPYFASPSPSMKNPRTNSVAEEDLTPWIPKIALCHKTPFQKRVLTALCQVPRGKFTTYAAISTYLNACPRSVGTALRDNPFAPDVPCHRVLTTGGGIGGFRGSWGRNGEVGKNDDKKRALLREEVVRFDGSGKAVGVAWDHFR